MLATAVVIGGITLWVFQRSERATPATVAAVPTPSTNDVGVEPAVAEVGVEPAETEPATAGPDEPGHVVVEPTAGPNPVPSATAPRLSNDEPLRPEPAPPTPPDPPAFEPVAASSPHGTLTINTLAWTHVYIDGQDTGRNTPIRALRVTPGPHVVRLVTQYGQVLVIDVDVAAGERQFISRRIQTAERGAVDEDE